MFLDVIFGDKVEDIRAQKSLQQDGSGECLGNQSCYDLVSPPTPCAAELDFCHQTIWNLDSVKATKKDREKIALLLHTLRF